MDDLTKSKLANLEKLREMGVNPYPYAYRATHHNSEIREQFAGLKNEEHSGKTARVAGRIKTIRRFGKLAFIDLWDETGKIQLALRTDHADESFAKQSEFLDMGDWIGAEGEIIKTKTGEISVLVKHGEVLCKSTRPLPEKWHGLTDVETRYRQRHLDLVMNPDVREVFKKRSTIVSALREFMISRGFMEVEIPYLQNSYGGANAKPFKTKSNALDGHELFLSISPELHLKRLIVGGYEKVFTIGKCFRNEDIDKTHNPEFTTMESYAAYQDYNDTMELVEDAYEYVAKKVLGTTLIDYQGTKIELKKPWKRLPMLSALRENGFAVEAMTEQDLLDAIEEHGGHYDGPKIKGLLIAELFETTCEEDLVQPTFVIDPPKETTPLCKPHRKNPDLIERFEPFINRWEIGNAYSELNDPILQREFLEKQAKEGRAGGTAEPVDEDFLHAIEIGMPPTGGLGLGIDRMTMLLTNQTTIKDVLFWPQMKNK